MWLTHFGPSTQTRYLNVIFLNGNCASQVFNRILVEQKVFYKSRKVLLWLSRDCIRIIMYLLARTFAPVYLLPAVWTLYKQSVSGKDPWPRVTYNRQAVYLSCVKTSIIPPDSLRTNHTNQIFNVFSSRGICASQTFKKLRIIYSENWVWLLIISAWSEVNETCAMRQGRFPLWMAHMSSTLGFLFSQSLRNHLNTMQCES